MQFLTSLFGGSGNMWLTALFALGIVILLIVIAMWLLRLLTGTTGRVGRGRNRRLMLVDSLAVDPRRQLLIVRRDNVEHLILTGGPTDLVVETGIPAAEAPAPARPVPVHRTPPPTKPAQPPAAAPRPAAALAPVPVHSETPAPVEPTSNVSPLDRLRAATGRRNGALRHPGLREEPALPQAAENSAMAARDSAKDFGDETGGDRSGGDDDKAQAEAEGRARDGR